MKKILGIAALALTAAIFIGCSSIGAAMSTSTKHKKEYQASVGTPKDSVVFYGFLYYNKLLAFSQMDPDFPPDCQEIENQIFISKPVAPGSTYVLERSKGAERQYVGQYSYLYKWDSMYSMQTAITPLVINIPEKPGLYYAGTYFGSALSDGSKAKPMVKSPKLHETACLKGALKLYKGTAWEEAINNRLEELKNEE